MLGINYIIKIYATIIDFMTSLGTILIDKYINPTFILYVFK